MQVNLREKLLHYKIKTIVLSDMEKMFGTKAPSYSDFAEEILAMENEGVLEMTKRKGRNLLL